MSDVEFDGDEDYQDEGIIDDFDEVDDPEDALVDVAEQADDDLELEEEPEGVDLSDVTEDLTFLDNIGADPTSDYIYNNSAKPADVIVVFADSEDLTITSRTITLYEYTRIVAIRSKQIAQHGRVYTDVVGLLDPEEMAKKEIRDRKCPLRIHRPIGTKNGKKIVEVFNVRTMNIPF